MCACVHACVCAHAHVCNVACGHITHPSRLSDMLGVNYPVLHLFCTTLRFVIIWNADFSCSLLHDICFE